MAWKSDSVTLQFLWVRDPYGTQLYCLLWVSQATVGALSGVVSYLVWGWNHSQLTHMLLVGVIQFQGSHGWGPSAIPVLCHEGSSNMQPASSRSTLGQVEGWPPGQGEGQPPGWQSLSFIT